MDEITKTRGYAIGAMSRETGVNIETIRYYERIGIMPKPDRTEGGNRQYNYDQLKRLFFIKRCRELGFSIEEIRALLQMVDRADFTCGEVHTMTVDHLTTVKKKVADLKRLEKALGAMAAQCGKGDVPACPIIDTLFSVQLSYN
ncbi:MAG: helix-turn-helix domain-containing protein [Salaquimonas sp.]